MHHLADLIIKNRRVALAIIAVLILASAYPLFNIRADFSLEGFFPKNDATIDQYREFSEEFGRDDNVIVIGISSGEIFSTTFLDEIRSLTDSLGQIEHVVRASSLLDAERLVNRNGSLESEPFITLDGSDAFLADDILAEMLDDPFTERLFISRDGTFTAIYISIDEASNSFPVRERIIADLDRFLLPIASKYEVYVAGIPYFRNQYIHLLNSEIIFYVSISSVLIILLLWVLFRNVQGVVIPIVIVWITIILTIAVLYWSGGYFEVLTSSIAPILLCVGVADSIHMLAKYNEGRFAGLSRRRSLRESLIVLGSATFLTSITTAIGFATLVTSNVIPMRTFGLYTAVGVVIAYLVTILLLPSILPYFRDVDPVASRQGQIHNAIGRFLRIMFNLVIKRHKLVVIGTLAFTIVAGAGISQLRVNGYIFDDVGRDSRLMKASNVIGERLSPQFPLEIVIDTGQENGITSPGFLKRLDDFQDFLLGFDEIEKSVSIATLLREVHRVMSDGPEPPSGLPDDRNLIAQYLLLLEISGGDELENIVDFTYGKARVALQVRDAGSCRMNKVRDEILEYVDANFPAEEVILTGTTILVADLTDNIVRSLAWSIGLAFLFISIIMAWLFRNVRLVLISLLPNLIPIVTIAGLMGYFGVDIKPSTAVIFTIAFGIAVDDSIHFLARFRIETRRGLNLVQAIRYTTEKTGRAIILTSMILIVGFGTLGFSDFHSTMLMGRLVCLTILMALVADLVFLPALIYWIKPELDSVRGMMKR